MDSEKISKLGYLARNVNGNRSPVAHLQCGSTLLSPGYRQWTVDQFKKYLIYYVNDDQPLDKMFEAFLFSPNRMPSGRFLNPMFTGFEAPSDHHDWQQWIEELFLPDRNLNALAEAVQQAGPFATQVDVWISLPYPEQEQDHFGSIDHVKLDFRRENDRLKAIEWWIQQFYQRFRNASLEYQISLRGFRWGREMITSDDIALVKKVADVVHKLGLQFLWLSNYGTNHAIDWESMGFDLLVLNPNYYGNTIHGYEWIDYAAYFSAFYHCGLQIIWGKGLLYSPHHILDYLNRGLPIYRDYMNQAFLIFTFDQVDIESLYSSDLPAYIRLYSFIKGIYLKTDYPEMPYS